MVVEIFVNRVSNLLSKISEIGMLETLGITMCVRCKRDNLCVESYIIYLCEYFFMDHCVKVRLYYSVVT